jgi:zinc D-Ala-D-Ala carboxypeptidase
MQLSTHYTLADLTASQTAARRRISNQPPEMMVRKLRVIAWAILEPVSAHFGVRAVVSSGYRSPKVNAIIGGSSSSQHMQCEAVDLKVPGVSNLKVAQWIRDNLLFDQLILEPVDAPDMAARWVHVSLNLDGPNRRQILGLDQPSRP